MINEARLKNEIEHISQFGALPEGGITREAFSEEEKEAREYVKKLLRDIGADIKEDGIGNIFARIKGANNSLAAVASGSHLDSVPFGGIYDGTLGVMCALEAIRSIKENKKSFKRPLELVIFSSEESSRFNLATVGSKVVSGKLDKEQLKKMKDHNGKSIYSAAQDFGCDVKNLQHSILKKDHFYAFVELHIEQGPVLERKKIPIGIVQAIASPIRYTLDLIGSADHSGATPMNMRKDTLVAASEVILGVEQIATTGKTTVATVGYAKACPGVLNVIPGRTTLGIDIRDIDKDALLRCDLGISELIKKIALKRGLTHKLTQLSKDFPTTLDEKIISMIEHQATKLNYKSLKLPSGAGHDAMNMKNIATFVGMIFIPCEGGISHNINEKIDIQNAYKATRVLKNTLLALANEE